MNQITIIGGGVSGRLLALNLLHQSPPNASVQIRIVDRCGEKYMGPAYSNDSPALLLNVTAEQMGAFSEEPEHFYRWAKKRDDRVEPGDFLPRGLFREYIFSLIDNIRTARGDNVNLEHICGEVTDVQLEKQRAVVHLETGERLPAGKVILALGNFPPRPIPIAHTETFQSNRYIGNPWNPGVFDALSPIDSVAFIGTGQTMVDLSLILSKRGHQGELIAVSRRGLLPLAHRNYEPYPSFSEEFAEPGSLLHLYRIIRRHLDRAAELGLNAQSVIDSLRPYTQALWSNLPEVEKRRFMRHVFRYWERIRSRIPPENEAVVNKLKKKGQLRIIAGRINDLVETNNGIELHYVSRRSQSQEIIRADYVVNCIGPETNYRKVDHPLVKNLLRRGVITPGPANIGISANPDGAIISHTGNTSEILYTLGATMKGLYWEVIAVPDIRNQAENLAKILLNGTSAVGAEA